MSDKVAFLPFHALNHFMFDAFRSDVINKVLNNRDNLDPELQKEIDRQTARHVKVPGFRNSAKAPARIKAKPMASAFEKNADLVAVILTAWTSLNGELAERVYDFLKARNWEILPIEADRRKIPGFLTRWRKSEEFDVLFEALKAAFPEDTASQDEVSLMIVWLSSRLPVDIVDDEEMDEVSVDQPHADEPAANEITE